MMGVDTTLKPVLLNNVSTRNYKTVQDQVSQQVSVSNEAREEITPIVSVFACTSQSKKWNLSENDKSDI